MTDVKEKITSWVKILGAVIIGGAIATIFATGQYKEKVDSLSTVLTTHLEKVEPLQAADIKSNREDILGIKGDLKVLAQGQVEMAKRQQEMLDLLKLQMAMDKKERKKTE